MHNKQLHKNHVNNDDSSNNNNTSCNINNNDIDNKTIHDKNVNDNISPSMPLSLCSAAYDVKEKYYVKMDTLSSTITAKQNNNENANYIGHNDIHNFDSNANNINNNLSLSLSSPPPSSSSSSSSCFNASSTILTVTDALAITKSSKDTDEKEI